MVFLEFPEAEKIIRMLNRKYHIEPSDAKGCRNWVNFAKTKNFEPYKKLIPKRPDIYYKKGNVHYEKLIKATGPKERQSMKKIAEKEVKKIKKDLIEKYAYRS